MVSAVTVNGVTLTSIDPNFKRPYTDEYSFAVDRELMANWKFSAVYTYRRERFIQATINPDSPYSTTPTTVVDPGPDGRTGTADDSTFYYFARIAATNRLMITNDPTIVDSYKGLELTVNKRFSNRWQMLAGYTLSKNQQNGYSTDTSPNFLINNNGNITGAANADRPNQFKLTGMYIVPFHDIIVSGNFRAQQGPPVTRQITQAVGFSTNQTINLEPLGNSRLGTLTTMDVRIGKLFKFDTHSLEATMDIDNLANAATVWQVRTLTTTAAFTDPTTGVRSTLPQFLSPAQILGPRTVVFRLAYKF